MEYDNSWDHLSQNTPMNSQTSLYHEDQPRSTLDRLMSQAQNSSQSQSKSRKRYNDIYTDSDSDIQNNPKPKRRSTNSQNTQSQPTLVIIKSPDVKLSKVSPIKIAKALNSIGGDLIKNVTKNNQGGITVRCHTASQAKKLKETTQLGQWTITTEFPKSETQSKGVITGIPTDITDDEIRTACKKNGVIDAKRIMRKRDGQLEESLSVCITFNTPTLPDKLQLGYESFPVKPYIPPIIRCFNCQRLGHVANNCRSYTRCVRCGGPHSYDQCQQREKVRCCRCGENHSSAYGGCPTIKQEKKIQGIRISYNISYADAAKVIKSEISIRPDDTPTQPTPQPRYTTINLESRPTPSTQTKTNPQPKTTTVTPTPKPQRDAATQTEETASTQTEDSTHHCLCSEQYIIELLTGAMQIWDNNKKKEDRVAAVKTLVEHITHSEEAPKSKQKQSKRRTTSKSPVNTKRNEYPSQKPSQTKPSSSSANPNQNDNQSPKGKSSKS